MDISIQRISHHAGGFWTALPAILLAVLAGLTVAGPVVESRQRGPEEIARAYLAAVERNDLDGALATVDPERREALRDRVALQLGNRYRVMALVVGRPSIVDRVTGRSGDTAWVTILADVTAATGPTWRSTSTARLVPRDGVWYLVEPVFA